MAVPTFEQSDREVAPSLILVHEHDERISIPGSGEARIWSSCGESSNSLVATVLGEMLFEE